MNKPLVIQGLSKSFNTTPAVNDLDLELSQGEIFVLLGPNGAGKTTTIRLIAGILIPDSGRITIGGYDLHRDPEKAKALIGLIPDSPFLYDLLTGREFIHFVGMLRGMDRSTIEARLGELNRYIDFGDWLDQRCGGYSHGMKQRLMFAQALLHYPELLLIDEPMVGLDPRAMLKVIDLLIQVKARTGILISTHLIPLAEELADRLGIIVNGKLKYLGERGEFSGMIEQIFLTATNV